MQVLLPDGKTAIATAHSTPDEEQEEAKLRGQSEVSKGNTSNPHASVIPAMLCVMCMCYVLRVLYYVLCVMCGNHPRC